MFNIIDAVTFEQLEENKNNSAFMEKHLLKMEDVLSKYEKISFFNSLRYDTGFMYECL